MKPEEHIQGYNMDEMGVVKDQAVAQRQTEIIGNDDDGA